MNKLLDFKKRVIKIHRFVHTVYESTILIEMQKGLCQEILIANGPESLFKINDLDFSIKPARQRKLLVPRTVEIWQNGNKLIGKINFPRWPWKEYAHIQLENQSFTFKKV